MLALKRQLSVHVVLLGDEVCFCFSGMVVSGCCLENKTGICAMCVWKYVLSVDCKVGS